MLLQTLVGEIFKIDLVMTVLMVEEDSEGKRVNLFTLQV